MTDYTKKNEENQISKEDAEWIRDNVNDSVADEDIDFEGELFLSTDGKNTVHVKAISRAGRKAALSWAKEVYDKLLYTYGTKQQKNVEAYSNGGFKCEECGGVAIEKEGVAKTGKKWKGIFCQVNGDHVKWT